jgi:hypothetical protein
MKVDQGDCRSVSWNDACHRLSNLARDVHYDYDAVFFVALARQSWRVRMIAQCHPALEHQGLPMLPSSCLFEENRQ